MDETQADTDLRDELIRRLAGYVKAGGPSNWRQCLRWDGDIELADLADEILG